MDDSKLTLYRTAIYAFVCISAVVGLVVVALGAIAHSTASDSYVVVFQCYVPVSGLFIAAGILIFALSFLGFCGISRRNYKLLFIFSCLQFGVFLLELIGIVMAFVYQNNLEETTRDKLEDAMKKFNQSDEDSADTQFWNKLQTKLDCCGVWNYTDWAGKVSAADDNFYVPDSCCRVISENCGHNVTDVNIYTDGCLDKIQDQFVHHIWIAVGLMTSVSVIQIIGLVFAVILIRVAKDEDYAYRF